METIKTVHYNEYPWIWWYVFSIFHQNAYE